MTITIYGFPASSNVQKRCGFVESLAYSLNLSKKVDLLAVLTIQIIWHLTQMGVFQRLLRVIW
jgi:hypothetical protein